MRRRGSRETLTANDDGDLADQADPEERINDWQSPHAVERLVPEGDVGEDRVRSELREQGEKVSQLTSAEKGHATGRTRSGEPSRARMTTIDPRHWQNMSAALTESRARESKSADDQAIGQR